MKELKGVVNVSERHFGRDKLVQLKLAFLVKIYELWHTVTRLPAAECGSLPGASSDKIKRSGCNFLPSARDTYNHRRTPTALAGFQSSTLWDQNDQWRIQSIFFSSMKHKEKKTRRNVKKTKLLKIDRRNWQKREKVTKKNRITNDLKSVRK